MFFYFHPYLGKISILTNIFEMGWNYQLVWGCVEIANLFRKIGSEVTTSSKKSNKS